MVLVYAGLAPSCFSGNSKVVIKEADEPVAIRDLRIGDHVLCVDGGDDLMTPGSGHWCPVMNFVRGPAVAGGGGGATADEEEWVARKSLWTLLLA